MSENAYSIIRDPEHNQHQRHARIRKEKEVEGKLSVPYGDVYRHNYGTLDPENRRYDHEL